ncbi:MAG: gluconate 2-dehydrogenase subunit 3 family protein [Actinobacteria bacterium]|nr:gluconate 2-dehydrogenase subunit 3 family protein [Actinomycetota bacterium]
MEGYPGYKVIDGEDSWDSKTRFVVERRVGIIPKPLFFDPDEVRTLEAAAARLLPQSRKEPIPIVPFVDEKLARNVTDGTRYENMPPMREFWRLFVATLDEEARIRHEKRFDALGEETQDTVLGAILKGETHSLSWRKIPARPAFEQIVSTVAAIYYAHPSAWSEIGWGGPKYPGIYVRVRCGRKDPEEAGEVGHVRD